MVCLLCPLVWLPSMKEAVRPGALFGGEHERDGDLS